VEYEKADEESDENEEGFAWSSHEETRADVEAIHC
jgi:hypothetical protein